ncbi:MAG: hypothetical protein ACREK5_06475 [Gemmatimonadota bacterium]
MKRRTKIVLGIAGGLVVLGVLGSLVDEETAPIPEGASSESRSEETRLAEIGCILLDAGPVRQLSSAEFDTLSAPTVPIPVFIAHMMDLEGPTSIRHVYAVRSPDHKLVHYISAEIDAPGLEGDGDVGTWARTGELDGPGLIQGVGGTRNLTRLVGQNDAFQITDDAARRSIECVEITEDL